MTSIFNHKHGKMANVEEYQLSNRRRHNRYFSKSFKKGKVLEIDRGLSTVSEISRTYGVSRTAVYKWLYQYSSTHKREPRLIVEKQSDTKYITALKERIEELERLVGQKEVELVFKDKLIDLASEELGHDIKKKFGSKRSSGSGSTEQTTDSQ